MKPGPPPTPTAIKRLAGNPGKRKLNEREPQPAKRMPEPPSDLPERARQLWEQLAPELEKLGVLTEIDGPAFAMLVIHYAVIADALDQIRRDGLMTIDERGLPRKHPLLTTLQQNSALFRQYCAEFGLTPAQRSRIVSGKDIEPETLDDLLSDD